MAEKYVASWDIPLFAGDEQRRSEMAAGQLQAINKVAEEQGLEQEYEEILLDEYGGSYTETTVEELQDIDFSENSLKRADIEYAGEEDQHIGVSYSRESIVGKNFRLEAEGDKELREMLEEETGEKTKRTGLKRVYDLKRFYNDKIKR